MSVNSPRVNWMTPRKSEPARLIFRLKHSDADALSASLHTEAEYSRVDDSIEVVESASSIVDLRARWNTLMRGLIASEQALRFGRE